MRFVILRKHDRAGIESDLFIRMLNDSSKHLLEMFASPNHQYFHKIWPMAYSNSSLQGN